MVRNRVISDNCKKFAVAKSGFSNQIPELPESAPEPFDLFGE